MLRALRAVLGRWLVRLDDAPPSVVERKDCSWFGCDPEALHRLLPRDPEEQDAAEFYRTHFRRGPWKGIK
jgi:hypothetical protein